MGILVCCCLEAMVVMARSRVQFFPAAPFVQLSENRFRAGSVLTWVLAWVWRGWWSDRDAIIHVDGVRGSLRQNAP